MLGLGTASVAFSQAGHAVNSTLAWLRQAVVGVAPGEPQAEPPGSPATSGEAGAHTSNPDGQAITYAARFFRVPEGETSIWQSLKDQGIEFVAASTDPEVYYTTLTREQGESFDAAVTLRCLSAPRVTVSAGGTATLAVTDGDPQKGRQGFALGLLPTVAGEAQEVQSTLSFHDGHKGFEIPNVATQLDGVVLIHVKGIHLIEKQADSGGLDFLIRIRTSLQ